MSGSEKAEEDYKAEMYETFAALGTKPQEWKWDGADPTENRGFGGVGAGTCQLCGKEHIVYEYTLVHVSGRRLIVGSECVSNFVDAAPYSEKRRARDTEKKLTLYNKMANFLVKKDGITYEQARKQADEMTEGNITRFFANEERNRNARRLAARVKALDVFVAENGKRLWDQNWFYFRQRTILSSLQYMRNEWAAGRETPYMEAPMNAELTKFGLQLPVKPKAKDLEKEEA